MQLGGSPVSIQVTTPSLLITFFESPIGVCYILYRFSKAIMSAIVEYKDIAYTCCNKNIWYRFSLEL